jgi:hypothetical protein
MLIGKILDRTNPGVTESNYGRDVTVAIRIIHVNAHAPVARSERK